MIIHLLKTAFRFLYRNRINTLINVLGLAISIAVFIFIVRYVQYQLNTDSSHVHADRIYRLEYVGFSTACSAGIKDLVEQSGPEVIRAVRYYPNKDVQLDYGEKSKTNLKSMKVDDILWADSSFLEVFSYPLKQGNPETCLSQPFSIVLTEAIAENLFGDDDPMGKMVTVNHRGTFKVSGILKNSHEPVSIPVNGLMSLVTMREMRGPDFLKNMDNWFFATYLLLSKTHNPDSTAARFSRYYNDRFHPNDPPTFRLNPLKSIYFESNPGPSDYSLHGNFQFLRILSAVAIFILLIAISNFINLSTAVAGLRFREVGIRKLAGANKTKLMRQYLSESVIIALFALLMALLFVELLRVDFEYIIATKIQNGFPKGLGNLLILIAGSIGIGVLAGIYPSFYLTSFQPVDVLKGRTTKGKNGQMLSRILIVFQFMVSAILIIGVLVIGKQLHFLKDKDLGYQANQIVYLDLNKDLGGKKDAFREKLLLNPQIKSVTFSSFKPGAMNGETFRREVNGKRYNLYYTMTDSDFTDVFQLDILQGRGFHKNSAADIGTAIVLNETAVKHLGLNEAVGTRISLFDSVGTVVGVVKDYHFQSMHHGIGPMCILNLPDWSRVCQIRLSGHDIPASLEYIQSVYESVAPGNIFDYGFMDQGFQQLYKSEERFATMFNYFAVLAVFIACIGLYGLIHRAALQKRHEICIRKVSGASVFQIVFMLLKDLSKWVLLAFLIACPIAWLALSNWLAGFAYQTNIGIQPFLLTGIILLLIAGMTMGYQAIRSAMMDPVKGLRSE